MDALNPKLVEMLPRHVQALAENVANAVTGEIDKRIGKNAAVQAMG
jgi:hypothetical protein